MGVFQTESLQMNFRVSVRNVVPIAVGVKEQIGWVQYPHTAASRQGRRNDVQTGHEIFQFVKGAISVRVLEDRDSVGSLHMVGRGWRRKVIVLDPPVLVMVDDLQSLRKGILQILYDPDAAALVKGQIDGLAYIRLSRHGFQSEAPGKRKLDIRVVNTHIGSDLASQTED